MNSEKFIDFIEIFEELTKEEKAFIFVNLNHIIERFNEKYKKDIQIRF